MSVSPERVTDISTSLLQHIAEAYPDATAAEVLSSVLTMSRHLIAVMLDHQNDEHTRAEMLKCLGTLEQEVWSRAPHTAIN